MDEEETNFKERLIEEIQKFPEIWDSNLESYNKRDVVHDSWAALVLNLSEFNKNEDECKVAYRSMRDHYLRKLKDIKKNPSKRTLKKAQKWRYFERMEFLKESLTRKKNVQLSNADSNSVICKEESDDDEDGINEEARQFLEPQNPLKRLRPLKPIFCSATGSLSSEANIETKQQRRSVHSKRKKSEISNKMLSNSLQQFTSALNQTEAEEDCFGKLLSSQLKRLDSSLKEQAMLELHQVMFKFQQQQMKLTVDFITKI